MGRDIEDLEANAARFWPTELARREQTTSIIPKLIESQEKFIGILYVADASPRAWKDVLQATKEMPANLFLKHLMVLSNVGGEKTQRYRTNIKDFFSGGTMTFRWKDAEHQYKFRSINGATKWSNAVLRVDGMGLVNGADLSPAMEDVAMLLMHGGASIDQGVPGDILAQCVVGTLIGRKLELDSFVRQRYIQVSRITGGASANKMGQLLQSYVREHLKSALPMWDFSRRTISGISQNEGRTEMSFDLVARSPSGKYCAIEISFQVTTNSTIERKAGQARDRQRALHRRGHKIAYVIDGAGNFERQSAVRTILDHCDYAATIQDGELNRLADFIRTLE